MMIRLSGTPSNQSRMYGITHLPYRAVKPRAL
jgi:hypothetical protein